MAAIAWPWPDFRDGKVPSSNVVTAVSIIMLAIFSFLLQLHSCFPCGDTNSLLLTKISWCKLSPITLIRANWSEPHSYSSCVQENHCTYVWYYDTFTSLSNKWHSVSMLISLQKIYKIVHVCTVSVYKLRPFSPHWEGPRNKATAGAEK